MSVYYLSPCFIVTCWPYIILLTNFCSNEHRSGTELSRVQISLTYVTSGTSRVRQAWHVPWKPLVREHCAVSVYPCHTDANNDLLPAVETLLPLWLPLPLYCQDADNNSLRKKYANFGKLYSCSDNDGRQL